MEYSITVINIISVEKILSFMQLVSIFETDVVTYLDILWSILQYIQFGQSQYNLNTTKMSNN